MRFLDGGEEEAKKRKIRRGVTGVMKTTKMKTVTIRLKITTFMERRERF